MSSSDPRGSLAALLSQTAEAHHRAFSATDGVDPDWPSWYAKYLLDNGFERVSRGSTTSLANLTELLVEADQRHRAGGTPQPWESYFAGILLESRRGGT